MPQKRLLTEEALRDAIRLKGEVDSFEIDADTIVTPAARTFLADRRIRLVTRSCCETPASAPATETAACADADGPTFVLEGLGVTVSALTLLAEMLYAFDVAEPLFVADIDSV